MAQFDGRVAWITGGGKGIGRAIALALAARGARVLVSGPEEKAIGSVVGEIAYGGGKARHFVADVRDRGRAREAAAKAIETWGSLDCVIANARDSARVELGTDVEHAEAILQTNVLGAYYTFDAAAHAMKGQGRLVAIAPSPSRRESSASIASHAAVLGLVQSAARELAPRAITCNAITPGEDVEPEEIAEVVLFLCGEGGRHMTGQALSIGSY